MERQLVRIRRPDEPGKCAKLNQRFTGKEQRTANDNRATTHPRPCQSTGKGIRKVIARLGGGEARHEHPLGSLGRIQ